MSLANPSTLNSIRPDPIKGIRAAGKLIVNGGHNSDMCVRADCFPHEKPGNPGTPKIARRFRKLTQMEPGIILKHPGQLDDKVPVPEGWRFGKPQISSSHVDDALRAQNLTGLADKFNDTLESIYRSRKMEPLGKPVSRNYNWP